MGKVSSIELLIYFGLALLLFLYAVNLIIKNERGLKLFLWLIFAFSVPFFASLIYIIRFYLQVKPKREKTATINKL